MSTIIVTGVGGDIGLPVARILAEAGHRVIGVDAGDTGHVPAFGIAVERVPLATDPAFMPRLTELARQVAADVVVPCIEPELPLWSEAARVAFPARVMAIAPALTALFGDKLSTARWLEEQGLAPPRSVPVADIDTLGGPVIVKRRRGSGGRGMLVLAGPQDYAQARTLGDEYFAQEALDQSGGELTCGVFRAGGETRVIQIRRVLAGGITHRGEVLVDPHVEALCRSIAENSRLEGAINVQLRRTVAGPRVFEINPRFSSTVLFRHLMGFSDVLWWLAALVAGPGPSSYVPPSYTPPAGALIYRTGLEVVVLPGQQPRCMLP